MSAVILAGGKGSRMGSLGRSQPKCILPLPNGQTLLTRLVSGLDAAGLDEVAICCSSENSNKINSHLQGNEAHLRSGFSGLRALPCLNTRLGPLPALAEIVAQLSSSWILMCLGDIFFVTSPFKNLVNCLNQNPQIDGCLATGLDEVTEDRGGTGWVRCDGPLVQAISYFPFREKVSTNEIRRWTGVFAFRSALADALSIDSAGYHDAPLELWIQRLIEHRYRLKWVEAGPFVNVNSEKDYEHLRKREESTYAS